MISTIQQVAVGFAAILISLTVHEFAHAWMADRLGDDTPRRHGRLTLNPLVIIRAHPVGALVIPLIGAYTGMLMGWAATPVSYDRVRRSITVRQAAFLISVAGPVSNLLLGALTFGLLVLISKIGLQLGLPGWSIALAYLARYLVICNAILAMFNMLPIPPLDGFTVLTTLLSRRHDGLFRFLEQYALILLFIVVSYGGHLFRIPLGLLNELLFRSAPILVAAALS